MATTSCVAVGTVLVPRVTALLHGAATRRSGTETRPAGVYEQAVVNRAGGVVARFAVLGWERAVGHLAAARVRGSCTGARLITGGEAVSGNARCRPGAASCGHDQMSAGGSSWAKV
jgi:hypothetical protein